MQRYFSTNKTGNYFLLNNDDIYHITRVMRYRDSEHIEIVYDSKVYLCCIENVNTDIKFKIEKELDSVSFKGPRTTLIIPFLKEQKMDIIFQKATELGVDEFVVIPLERSVIKVKEDKLYSKVDRWQRIVKEASEQSMRTDKPIIRVSTSISNLEELDGLKLICSTVEKENYIKNILKNNTLCDRINLVIGPEGGLTPAEEKKFETMGFVKTTLGPQIMRVETVPMFLMSVIKYEYME